MKASEQPVIVVVTADGQTVLKCVYCRETETLTPSRASYYLDTAVRSYRTRHADCYAKAVERI